MRIMQQPLPQPVKPQRRPATPKVAPGAVQTAAAPNADTLNLSRPVHGVRFGGKKEDQEALLWAALNGEQAKVKRLLEKSGLDVNYQDIYGNTALMWAADKGHTEIARMLLEKKAKPDLQNQNGDTTLTLAAWKGHTEIARMLLAKEAKPDLQTKNGDTALTLAAWKGYTEIAKLLLAKEAKTDLQTKNGNTALTLAADKGHTDITRMLLEKKANPDLKTTDGNTALMSAAWNGHRDVAELLLTKGADFNHKNDMGKTALMLAEQKGYTEVATLLKAAAEAAQKEKASTAKPQANPAGPSIAPPHEPLDAKEAFLEAAGAGDIDKVKSLLNQSGVDINQQDADGWTALMSAAAAGHHKVVDLLLNEKLDRKIDIDRKNAAGNTALTLAAAAGHLDTVKSLLNKEGDIHHQDKNGHTALTSAALNGHRDVVELLLDNEADIHHKDKNGWTALKWAAEMGHPEVVDLLLAKGADTHHQDNDTSSSSGSDDEAPGSSTGASSSRRGRFSDYNEYRQARREAKWKLVQGALLAAGCVAAGVLAVVCPPVFALGAALATGTGGLIVSTVQKFFSLTSDLANNPSALPRFKKDVQKISNNFKNWVDKHVDPLRKNPRYRPHAEFFIRLSNTLEQFSKNIQDKDYQESMKAALAFERKMLNDMMGHVFSFGKKEERQKIGTIQTFLRDYNKYLSKLDLNQLRDKDGLRMEYMVKIAEESGVPELVEWSKNPDNLANQLSSMQLRNES